MYSKCENYVYNPPMRPLTESEIRERYPYRDERGQYRLRRLFRTLRISSHIYEWQGIRPPEGKEWAVTRDRLQELYDEGCVDFSLSKRLPSLKVYLDEHPMTEAGTIWDDIGLLPGSKEREPFPSQKAVALLDRIIQMSSEPGDFVLDPFCGSGTALVAAQGAGRQWIGCDVSEQAYSITIERLHKTYGLIAGSDFEAGDHTAVETRYSEAHPVEQETGLGVSLFRSESAMQSQFAATLDTASLEKASVPYIMTEGKTDWKHLKAAYDRLAQAGYLDGLEVAFYESEKEQRRGDAELLKVCETYPKMDHGRPIICIFDHDNLTIVKKVMDEGCDFRDWGNMVFSLALPVPEHRTRTPDICIELYYRDEEIKRRDRNGRRLYLSDEFSDRSGRHMTEDLNCMDQNKVCRPAAIIDDRVFDRNGQNVALSKNDFAEYVLTRAPNFANFDVSEFEKLFRLIARIVESEC
jgi:RNA-directed DNA polymerase